jgi:mRNA-degrading endonuclease toxin of MazEF toxin-antitoxin module
MYQPLALQSFATGCLVQEQVYHTAAFSAHPNEVLLSAASAGLKVDSIALCYQIRTLNKTRLERDLGVLADISLRQAVLHAIRFQLEL